MKTAILTLGGVWAIAAMGCADEETLAPLGGGGGAAETVTSTATSTTASTTGAGGLDTPDPPVTPIREVFQRDPFGNVAQSQNLLWDGDFEWESAFSDQYGWLENWQFGLRKPLAGPQCRSGIKCVELAPLGSLIGIGLSSSKGELYGSVWVHPSTGVCAEVKVTLFTDPLEEGEAEVTLSSGDVDDAGWCFFEGLSPERRDKTYLLVSIPELGTSAIVDDAVVRVATSAESGSSSLRSLYTPTERDLLDVEEARRALRITRGPREGAPDPARRALERWARGEGRRNLKKAAQAPGDAR